jgi:hypothetical protein
MESVTMKAIFGSIEFGYLCFGRDTTRVALFHSVTALREVSSEDEADSLLDELGESYLILDNIKHEIMFANIDAAASWQQVFA